MLLLWSVIMVRNARNCVNDSAISFVCSGNCPGLSFSSFESEIHHSGNYCCAVSATRCPQCFSSWSLSQKKNSKKKKKKKKKKLILILRLEPLFLLVKSCWKHSCERKNHKENSNERSAWWTASFCWKQNGPQELVLLVLILRHHLSHFGKSRGLLAAWPGRDLHTVPPACAVLRQQQPGPTDFPGPRGSLLKVINCLLDPLFFQRVELRGCPQTHLGKFAP